MFSGNLSYSVRKGIIAIDEAIPNISWLLVVQSSPRTLGRLLRNQGLNLMRNGWRWIPYQAGDIVRRIRTRGGFPVGKHTPGSAFTVEALRERTNLRLLAVSDLHANATLDAVRNFGPDLGLSLAAPILRPSIFGIPRLGTINLHKGRVPDYRGMPPAFWELWNDEISVGCTVHRVAEKLDAGDVVREVAIRREKYSTVHGLQLVLDETGVSLMRDAVQDVLAGTLTARSQDEGGRTYRKPTLAQVAALERRIAPSRINVSVGAKRIAKASILAALRLGTAVGLHRALAPRITVLLYHRITDEQANLRGE